MTHLDSNTLWTTRSISEHLWQNTDQAAIKKTERWVSEQELDFLCLSPLDIQDEHERPCKQLVVEQLIENAKKKRHSVFMITSHLTKDSRLAIFANDARNGRRWVLCETEQPSLDEIEEAIETICRQETKDCLLLPSGAFTDYCRFLTRKWKSNSKALQNGHSAHIGLEVYSHGYSDITSNISTNSKPLPSERLTHLDRLEAESIHIFREVISEADNPVMLYSIGKDSSVMLHLARKAFYPSPPPFPLLHIDTKWKFQAMYDFRDYIARASGMDLLIHVNPEAIDKGINPFDHGAGFHTDITKTQSLKQALDQYKFDVSFGGARREEEKSRSKERIFSFRTDTHYWDPKNQRPELWHQYNGRKHKGESIRVFPISNWTELDIWQYIYREQIPIVPLYFAAERPVVERDGTLLMVDDDRLRLYPNEKIQTKKVRFRSLGCYPLTGAIESEADDLPSIILELLHTKTGERHGRTIDSDLNASLEKKKQEGYF